MTATSAVVPAAALSARQPGPDAGTVSPFPSAAVGTAVRPLMTADPPAMSTSGLPSLVVQRITRQSFGRFRLCYETGSVAHPELHGDVVVTFRIDATGNVVSATGAGSTLGDPAVVQCVVRAFGNLSFPSPKGGPVDVTYTLHFVPAPAP
jgi:TonB family protein